MHGRWQYCTDGYDTSGNLYAKEDATEIRLWANDLVIVAMVRTPRNRWRIEASDVSHTLSLNAYKRRFATPEALVAYISKVFHMIIVDEESN